MKRVFYVSEKYHGGSGAAKFKWQKKQGNYLATSGLNRTVFVFDRRGHVKDEISLPGLCTSLDWDKDGDVLAIIQDKTGVVYLWDANSQRTTQLDTGMK
jgi:WD repeat-containing protein 19